MPVYRLIFAALLITSCGIGGCAPSAPNRSSNHLAPEIVASLPVKMITWEGVEPGIRRGAVGVFLESGEFRTAWHVLEIHPDSGIFLAHYKLAYLDGKSVEWKVSSSGEYRRFRAGEEGEDWAQLRLAPDPAIRGLPFDGTTPLHPGDRVYVAGFDKTISAIQTDMNFEQPIQIYPARIVSTPPRNRRESDNIAGLAFLQLDTKGILPGWSGAPVIAIDPSGKARVVGTLTSAYSTKGTLQNSEAPNFDDIQYATFVRNGPSPAFFDK